MTATLNLPAQVYKNFTLNGVIGFRLHTSDYQSPSFPDAWELKSSLLLGLELRYKNWPVSLGYVNDRNYSVYNPPANVNNISNVFNKGVGNLLTATYNRGLFKFGLGHYWYLNENFGDYLFSPADRTRRYITLSFGLDLGNIEIEYVKLAQYSKLFALLGPDLNSINLKYKIGKRSRIVRKKRDFALSYRIGLRHFVVRNTFIAGEKHNKLGTAVMAGIDVRYHKLRSSVFLERDCWVAVNGGSFVRQIKGYASNSVLGIRHSFPALKNLELGFGYAYITDNNIKYKTRENIQLGLERENLWYYNVKGLSIGIGMPLSNHFNIDIRSIIPLRGEKGFNPMRQSIGISYNLRS